MIQIAAIQFHIDKTNELVTLCGYRHDDILMQLKLLGFEPHKDYQCVSQGFLTDKGEYLNRQEALIHAQKCGQISTDIDRTELFSEDLW